MSEKKAVTRNAVISLGTVCIILAVGLVGSAAIMEYQIQTLASKTSSEISSLQSQLSGNLTCINQLLTWLNGNVSKSEPYIQSQLLRFPTTDISANGKAEGWILNWTPKTSIRIIKVQVWMGNPGNVVWEGDTFVTVGKPDSPWNPDSYNATVQLLVHYQFDSHAPSPIPHQLMFDLSPSFKVASGRTINIYRLFVNTEPNWINAGDIEAIIYYENA